MEINGWKYYNHAAVPCVAPYEEADLFSIKDKSIWKMKGTPLLARWTTGFDCGYETNWWYIIKDTPFDIGSLKAKRRYEVNKGIKNFEVKIINPCAYKEELYVVQAAAFSAYPKKYRPTVDKEKFMKEIDSWKKFIVFGAFFRETGDFAGYAFLSKVTEKFLDFNVQKANPKYEKYAVNAALIEKILSHYEDFLTSGGIICDGARSVSHETKFQDYLEKYFDFRKAYCNLHIEYNPKIYWLIRVLYPARKLMQKFDKIRGIHQLSAILKMEEILHDTSE